MPGNTDHSFLSLPCPSPFVLNLIFMCELLHGNNLIVVFDSRHTINEEVLLNLVVLKKSKYYHLLGDYDELL